jgi:hypothetical protein
LSSTTDLNTSIISKDECQKRDLARRVVPRDSLARGVELPNMKNITFINQDIFRGGDDIGIYLYVH